MSGPFSRVGTMKTSMEEKIRYLLRAALRAEHEGERRVARILRRMAEEACPVGGGPRVPMLDSASLERCPE